MASLAVWSACGDADDDQHVASTASDDGRGSSGLDEGPAHGDTESGHEDGTGGAAPGDTTSGGATADATTTNSGEDETSMDTTAGVAPGYSPLFAMDCNDGTPGDLAVGPDGMEGATRVEYSSDQAVDGRGQSCRTWIDAGDNFFGGRYLSLDTPVGDGDDIWMRQGLFFPEGFCFGFGDSPGDGWGAIKWMRIEFDNGGAGGGPGNRLTLQLGNVAGQACNDETEVYGATREYAGNANLRPESSPPIPTGEWHMVQWHVHLATDDGAFIRFWVDDTYLGQVDDVTLGAPDRQIAFINYGDYWNGSPFEDASWYTDEIIMTVETPDTLDAAGNPYIAPDARADDWD